MKSARQIVPTKAVCVADLETALLAAEVSASLDVQLVLISEPGAASSAGGGWWCALADAVATKYPEIDMLAILDCADVVGSALNAIRAGCRDLAASDPPAALVAFAKANDVTIHTVPPAVLELGRLNARTGAVIRRFLQDNPDNQTD
jgi:hypothetical protein